MATTKPRITITLTHRQHEVLQAMATYSGKPMSATISELIEAAAPTLERMAATFQRIKQHQDQERQRMIRQLDDAQSVMEPLVMETLNQFDMFLGKVEKAAGAGDAGGATATAATESPATNRGDTPPTPTPPNPRTGAASSPIESQTVFGKKGGKKS
jgi:cell pole-organizing protein PopZ